MIYLEYFRLFLCLCSVLDPHTPLQYSRTLSASRIRKSNSMLQSCVVSKALCLALSGLSFGSRTTPIRWFRKMHARTATNSTCANFAPGQFCGPSDQGKYVLCAGVRIFSECRPGGKCGSEGVKERIHREGRQRRGSCQYLGSV